jgi:predicted dehydrogenase
VTTDRKVKVGIIGCGKISPAYFKGCRAFDILDVVACADIDMSRARAKAAEFGVQACTDEELLAIPDIEIVVNLTWPKAHTAVSLMAIEAGKNVHSEKPLAINRLDGQKTVAAARAKGVLAGCAPDTFMGGGIQTCRKLIDEGAIGRPVAAVAFFTGHGPEGWHPDPAFFFQVGGGPVLDMGPYYLTALVNLIGPIKRVCGSTSISFAERVITSQPLNGTRVKVEVPTHVAGVLDFANGAVATIVTSFDVWGANLPHIEIYGTEGSLSVPDPNRFDGRVLLLRAGEKTWNDVPLTHSIEVGRGIGVADMAYALRYGRPQRPNGDLAYHVLDVMCAFDEAAKSGRYVDIQSTCRRPAPLPAGLPPNQLDH